MQSLSNLCFPQSVTRPRCSMGLETMVVRADVGPAGGNWPTLMILVTYDVATTDKAGQTRLRRVAKICQNYGQRVQDSVFECLVEPAQYVRLKSELSKVMDEKEDSLRFYQLGANWQRRVEHLGAKHAYDPQGVLMV